MKNYKKITLSEREMPTTWYNIVADMPVKPLPPLNPKTKRPATREDFLPIFAEELVEQEFSLKQFIEIPEQVQDLYKIWRSTPLVRAYALEKALDTPAKIYFKNESTSMIGSHKPNTAIPQAYYNYKQGIHHLTTETGGGQWGSALSFAARHFGIDLKVFMVKVSYNQKPYRKLMMNTWGADVIPSPSSLTDAGRKILRKHPDSSGSLGIAVSEAIEMAVKNPHTNYAIGSVLNHVLLHQTIIGEEALLQMAKTGDYPDIVIGCFGGGSNFAGIAFPFLRQNLTGNSHTRIIAVEPQSCPKLTRGTFQYDYGDTVGSIVSQLLKDRLIEASDMPQLETFEAGTLFARTEGIIPAPESTHAIAQAIREARQAKEEGISKTILFNLSGHGMIDLYAYEQYFAGKLHDYTIPEHEINASIDELEKII